MSKRTTVRHHTSSSSECGNHLYVAHFIRIPRCHRNARPETHDKWASSRAFEARDGCPASIHRAFGENANGTGRVTSVFPEIPALEVAYAAYRRSFADGGEEMPQGIPGGLSADQVFFMTMCYMTCTLPGAVGTQSVDCNKAVRNSEAFAQAFRCTPGSPMNPKKKCTFFT